MPEEALTVTDASGRRGTARLQDGPEGRVLIVRFEDGYEQALPPEALRQQADGSYQLELDDLELGALEATARLGERQVIPVVAEEVLVGTRERRTRVVVRKEVETRTETVEVPLRHTDIEVKRVPVNRVLEEPAEVRTEGDVTIVPVMAERLVVYTELVLVEELHLIRRESEELYRGDVSLREETVRVERKPLDEDGAP